MPFTAFHKHCQKCREGESCGNFHVYALELREEVLERTWFANANKGYKRGKPCLYIGRTKHLPKCRVSQHEHCKTGEWRGKRYMCYCSGSAEQNPCKISNRGSSKVKEFNTYLLRGKIFRSYNPQYSNAQNIASEKKLAEDLRAEGYGIWAGHLDAP